MLQKEVSNKYVKYYSDKVFKKMKNYETLVKNLNLDLKNKKILDLPSGPGQFEIIFDTYKPKLIVCQDKFTKYLDEAKKQHKKYNLKTEIKYVANDMMDLKYPKEEFDLIFSHVSFFYAKNEKKLLKNMKRVLKKNGYIYIKSHNIKNIAKEKWTSPSKYLSYIQYFINLHITSWKFFPAAAQSMDAIIKLAKEENLNVVLKKEVEDTFEILLKKK